MPRALHRGCISAVRVCSILLNAPQRILNCPLSHLGQLVLIAAQVARQGSSAPRARHSRAACRGQTDLWNCNQSNICPPRACWPRSISYRTAGAPVAQPRTPLRRAVAAREGSAADTTAARATRTPCVGILGVCLIPLLFPENCHSIPAGSSSRGSTFPKLTRSWPFAASGALSAARRSSGPLSRYYSMQRAGPQLPYGVRTFTRRPRRAGWPVLPLTGRARGSL